MYTCSTWQTFSGSHCVSSSGTPRNTGEQKSVGSANHRKTRSRSSIDWSLINKGSTTSISGDVADEHKDSLNEDMTALKQEESMTVPLPSFMERLVLLSESDHGKSRWFPYVYEVVVMQWSLILREKKRNRSGNHKSQGSAGEKRKEALSLAVNRLDGLTATSAPMLFEVIKKSLGYRVSVMFEEVLKKKKDMACPPLVTLDETLMDNLEIIITMVADTCIDSRNFDSKERRNLVVAVNDSIVRFLRDLFSIIAPSSSARLVISYMNRFAASENKARNGDSKIGLNYDWEVTKLRLNAVTAFVRFPYFVRINSPQLLSWGDWVQTTSLASMSFFDKVLHRFDEYSRCDLVGGLPDKDHNSFKLHPHWLAELVVDVCLKSCDHPEVYIQHRASSLLFELFWSCYRESVLSSQLEAAASMFITFLEKVLSRIKFLSSHGRRSQLRKDIMPCVIFVLQSTPDTLLCALWRKLCLRLRNREKGTSQADLRQDANKDTDSNDAMEFFSLLNLALSTVEYEGSEEQYDGDSTAGNNEAWRREFLPAQVPRDLFQLHPSRTGTHRTSTRGVDPEYTSSTSRKWFSHDSSLVVVNAGNQVVSELYTTLSSSSEGEALLNPAIYGVLQNRGENKPTVCPLKIGLPTIVLFVRAACSLYLHALSLRQSDIVFVRTFKLSAEIIKMFGIKTFLEAVGETLQHWLRVTAFQCGARRASVRVEATDLLELILRGTWESYGSFFRVRVPLFAVFTEVMERIVATAESRFYIEQRRKGLTSELFSPIAAEASLVPLWRTLDRMQTQPASHNVAFRGALVRMAEKLKILYRAYIAARVISHIQDSRSNTVEEFRLDRDQRSEGLQRATRISILLVLNASEGYSKQFLGYQGTQQQQNRVAHFEAVEDALMDAANVFSSSDLPEHRVAWLKMLARFHAAQAKHAEEATCHFQIHLTYQQVAPLHRSLWSSSGFLPWTDSANGGILERDCTSVYPEYASELEEGSLPSTQMGSSNVFRRIFYRNANSVALDFSIEDGMSKTLHCGVTLPEEYNSTAPWIPLRELEEDMLEEAESAGDLFLKAGIVESSRLSWNLATMYYADKFNYPKLALVYRQLALTVVSKVPSVDTSLPQEVSTILGRFYRVWFHGGAPDELSGIEFVYRAEGDTRLAQFGESLKNVVKSIIPDKTPIHLTLDSQTETRIEDSSSSQGFSRISSTLEPVRIKVTPLRPKFGLNCRRGLPEWFFQYIDEAELAFNDKDKIAAKHHVERRRPGFSLSNASIGGESRLQHRQNTSSFSASMFSSNESYAGAKVGRPEFINSPQVNPVLRNASYSSPVNGELAGVDKFCFLTPKDRRNKLNDWWKQKDSAVTEKSLKLTELQVSHLFPACISRQTVIHRVVTSQSPLEAGVDAVCQWCAVLFRTAVATSGMSVLRPNPDTGIGTDAAKVVADAIHSSHVKELGSNFLKENTKIVQEETTMEMLHGYDNLSSEEKTHLQEKLAKLIVVFIQLLHILIVRNRNILLGVIQQRKKISEEQQRRGTAPGSRTPNTHQQRRGSHGSDFGTPSLPQSSRSSRRYESRQRRTPSSDQSIDSGSWLAASVVPPQTTNARTDSAIAVQSELQRGFINMIKVLYPVLELVLGEAIPDWLLVCTQDNYFSLRSYNNVEMPITRELWFAPVVEDSWEGPSEHGSVASKGSERHMYGYGNF